MSHNLTLGDVGVNDKIDLASYPDDLDLDRLLEEEFDAQDYLSADSMFDDPYDIFAGEEFEYPPEQYSSLLALEDGPLSSEASEESPVHAAEVSMPEEGNGDGLMRSDENPSPVAQNHERASTSCLPSIHWSSSTTRHPRVGHHGQRQKTSSKVPSHNGQQPFPTSSSPTSGGYPRRLFPPPPRAYFMGARPYLCLATLSSITADPQLQQDSPGEIDAIFGALYPRTAVNKAAKREVSHRDLDGSIPRQPVKQSVSSTRPRKHRKKSPQGLLRAATPPSNLDQPEYQVRRDRFITQPIPTRDISVTAQARFERMVARDAYFTSRGLYDTVERAQQPSIIQYKTLGDGTYTSTQVSVVLPGETEMPQENRFDLSTESGLHSSSGRYPVELAEARTRDTSQRALMQHEQSVQAHQHNEGYEGTERRYIESSINMDNAWITSGAVQCKVEVSTPRLCQDSPSMDTLALAAGLYTLNRSSDVGLNQRPYPDGFGPSFPVIQGFHDTSGSDQSSTRSCESQSPRVDGHEQEQQVSRNTSSYTTAQQPSSTSSPAPLRRYPRWLFPLPSGTEFVGAKTYLNFAMEAQGIMDPILRGQIRSVRKVEFKPLRLPLSHEAHERAAALDTLHTLIPPRPVNQPVSFTHPPTQPHQGPPSATAPNYHPAQTVYQPRDARTNAQPSQPLVISSPKQTPLTQTVSWDNSLRFPSFNTSASRSLQSSNTQTDVSAILSGETETSQNHTFDQSTNSGLRYSSGYQAIELPQTRSEDVSRRDFAQQAQSIQEYSHVSTNLAGMERHYDMHPIVSREQAVTTFTFAAPKPNIPLRAWQVEAQTPTEPQWTTFRDQPPSITNRGWTEMRPKQARTPHLREIGQREEHTPGGMTANYRPPSTSDWGWHSQQECSPSPAGTWPAEEQTSATSPDIMFNEQHAPPGFNGWPAAAWSQTQHEADGMHMSRALVFPACSSRNKMPYSSTLENVIIPDQLDSTNYSVGLSLEPLLKEPFESSGGHPADPSLNEDFNVCEEGTFEFQHSACTDEDALQHHSSPSFLTPDIGDRPSENGAGQRSSDVGLNDTFEDPAHFGLSSPVAQQPRVNEHEQEQEAASDTPSPTTAKQPSSTSLSSLLRRYPRWLFPLPQEGYFVGAKTYLNFAMEKRGIRDPILQGQVWRTMEFKFQTLRPLRRALLKEARERAAALNALHTLIPPRPINRPAPLISPPTQLQQGLPHATASTSCPEQTGYQLTRYNGSSLDVSPPTQMQSVSRENYFPTPSLANTTQGRNLTGISRTPSYPAGPTTTHTMAHDSVVLSGETESTPKYIFGQSTYTGGHSSSGSHAIELLQAHSGSTSQRLPTRNEDSMQAHLHYADDESTTWQYNMESMPNREQGLTMPRYEVPRANGPPDGHIPDSALQYPASPPLPHVYNPIPPRAEHAGSPTSATPLGTMSSDQPSSITHWEWIRMQARLPPPTKAWQAEEQTPAVSQWTTANDPSPSTSNSQWFGTQEYLPPPAEAWQAEEQAPAVSQWMTPNYQSPSTSNWGWSGAHPQQECSPAQAGAWLAEARTSTPSLGRTTHKQPSSLAFNSWHSSAWSHAAQHSVGDTQIPTSYVPSTDIQHQQQNRKEAYGWGHQEMMDQVHDRGNLEQLNTHQLSWE
ncbi:hypothetical protein CVT26_003598 [Gymnopilus dilepis]|uniref:Uncharacterized protein n=1 Tax=Gymnopilus dilepis TaxID=231916 RepID=A0A409W1U2_9AGAR|nr:hypothetical protein CVT26_003598 [Gymnopilus dilepis]